MTFIAKPRIDFKGQRRNRLGLTLRDYEGGLSTLCAGCGHDSISAAIVQSFFDLDIPPHMVAKVSGIGCSSKTPAYFLHGAHGVNAVHGRMPSLATGANAANRNLHLIGVSGDGDSLSIGLGQFAHAVRRNLDMLYIIENNGVYGLTKGQFSASADIGSTAKKGDVNLQQPIDPLMLALSIGATFVARGFSGDKLQLVPLIKAGLGHGGFGLIDVISPCVTFNDHEASTKSYAYTRGHRVDSIYTDFVPPADEIVARQEDDTPTRVRLHDGSHVMLRKAADDYDPTDRAAAITNLLDHQQRGEVVTGLIYINEAPADMHGTAGTVDTPLVNLPYESLSPGAAALDELQAKLR